MNKPNINKKPWPGAVSLWAIAALMNCFGLAQLTQAVGGCTEIASGLDLPVGTQSDSAASPDAGAAPVDARVDWPAASGRWVTDRRRHKYI
jgi:hypothetical protein